MKKFALLIFAGLVVAGCNSVNIKPGTLDKSETIYALYGGYHMRHAVKQELEDRGYKVVVGKQGSLIADEQFTDMVRTDTMGARYVLRVREPTPSTGVFEPVICMFNGWRWWVFDLSIADQKTGEELLAWSGRGCANASIRRFRRLMSEVERR